MPYTDPKDVDTASALALLQEEELDTAKKKAKADYKAFTPVGRPKTVDSKKPRVKAVDDKLGSLKAYRR